MLRCHFLCAWTLDAQCQLTTMHGKFKKISTPISSAEQSAYNPSSRHCIARKQAESLGQLYYHIHCHPRAPENAQQHTLPIVTRPGESNESR